jgi:hypothetical protein
VLQYGEPSAEHLAEIVNQVRGGCGGTGIFGGGSAIWTIWFLVSQDAVREPSAQQCAAFLSWFELVYGSIVLLHLQKRPRYLPNPALPLHALLAGSLPPLAGVLNQP